MSSTFEDAIIDEFSGLDFKNFHVNYSFKSIFLCGGEVNSTADIPPSFRDRLMRHTATSDSDLHDSFVLAETFKDYFKENTYTDLLVFEDDIAKISTLVIVLLESPGAMVELGLFCSKPELYKKLLIVAPQEHVQNEDSFIYLGPLEYIRKKESSSVVVYPWPSNELIDYDSNNLDDLCLEINKKIDKSSEKEKFNFEHSGHIALLICEIINVCFPVILTDIEFAFAALNINVKQSHILRQLYLLTKFNMISVMPYGNSYKYYFPLDKDKKKVMFGKSNSGKVVDTTTLRISMAKSYYNSNDPQAKRRQSVQKLIMKKLKGDDK
jgi:hypothetical protein